jgi:hypothetical protein
MVEENNTEHDLLEAICLTSLSNDELMAFLSELDEEPNTILKSDPVDRIIELSRVPWRPVNYLDAVIEIATLVELHSRPNLSIRNKMDVTLTIVNQIEAFKSYPNAGVIRSIYGSAITDSLSTIRRKNMRHQNLLGECTLM